MLLPVTQSFMLRAIPFLVLAASLNPLTFPAAVPQQTKGGSSFAGIAKQAAEARDADHLDEAVGLYQKALTLKPNWAEGWFSLGTLEYDRNNYAAAAHAFQQLLPLAPKEGSAHAMLGLCEYELGRYDAALKHIEEARSLGVANNPQFRQVVLYHEGLLYLRISKFEAAHEALAQLCRENATNQDTLLAMGMVALRIPGGSPVPRSTPGWAVLNRVGHAACLASAQKYDEARPEFAAVVRDYPDYPDIHYAYGKFLSEINAVPEAVEQFKIEIEHNPKAVAPRLEIAANEYKTDSAAGIPYAEEAIRLAPHIAFGHYLLGLLYLDTGNYPKAIPQLEAAAKAFPRDSRVFFALSSAYSRTGRKEEATRARLTSERLKNESDLGEKANY